MTALAHVNDFLSHRRLAVVGVSRNPRDFTRTLFREFLSRGYDAVPVHPGVAEIEGRPCFARMTEIRPPVDAALLVTAPAVTDEVVRDCAAAGVKHVWMYQAGGRGAVSPEAVGFCAMNGIDVIPGECPFMFFPKTGLLHRIHAWFRRRSGHYPK